MERAGVGGSQKMMMPGWYPLRIWIYIFWMLLFFCETVWAQKTDIVVLKNGDHITGEVKELKLGKLKYKTDDAGTIYIEWDKVASLSSKDTFELENGTGDKFYGAITSDTTENSLLVLSQNQTISMALISIVRIVPIEDSFIKRLDGSVDLGFSYTKASEIGHLFFNGDLRHRSRRTLTNLSTSSTHTFQPNEETTKRNNLRGQTLLYLPNRWVSGGLVKLERNSELGIDFRLSTGGGFGRFLIESNFSQLIVFGGIQYNQEWVEDGEPVDFNLEALTSISFKKYRFDTPKLDFSTILNIFPELTPVGRIRAEYDMDLKWEIVKDFFWNLNLYDQFDSQPASNDASKNDWGIILSFGLSF